MSVDLQQLAFLIILSVSFILLVSERIRSDLVAVLIVLALSISEILTPEEALAGFSSEPAIIVAAIFVLTGALQQTGVSESVGNWIGRWTGSTYNQTIAVIMPVIALLSAFTHHVATTAFMVPVVLNLSREREIPPSKLLMPLSFAASLGTSITIVGAPAFLIASAALRQAGRPGLSIFSIAPIGLTLTVAGTLFMLIAGRFLLPTRPENKSSSDHLRLDRYYTELTILPESTLIGKTLEEVKAVRFYEFVIAGWIRNNQRLPRPFDEEKLEPGDVLLVHTPPEHLITFHQDSGVALHPLEQFKEYVEEALDQENLSTKLVQAVVAPRSEMIGRSLREIDFRKRYGALVVAFWRRRSFVQKELARIRLRAGDVLVLQGEEDAISRVGRDPAFLMLVPFHAEPRLRQKAPLAAFIMLATIGIAILNPISLEIVMLAGAVAMILAGCITPGQAYKAIDARIYVFIAGAVPLGTAMQNTGVSDAIAHHLQGTVQNWPQFLILLMIFAVTAIITQFMSDAATTALFAPLAASLAIALGHTPEPFVVVAAMGSVVAFLTPMGHHGNLLIYGLGGYRFRDFLRVGTPLTALVAVLIVILSPLMWPN